MNHLHDMNEALKEKGCEVEEVEWAELLEKGLRAVAYPLCVFILGIIAGYAWCFFRGFRFYNIKWGRLAYEGERI